MDPSPVEREAVEIRAFGLHWEALDEDVSVEGLLAGRGDRAARGSGGGAGWVVARGIVKTTNGDGGRSRSVLLYGTKQ